jgi:ABC-type multidrug transport system fused ATPase/permease subunit
MIESGQIVEAGTQEELLTGDSLFYRMYEQGQAHSAQHEAMATAT